MEALGRPANETRVGNAGLLGVDGAGDLLYVEANAIRRIVDAAA